VILNMLVGEFKEIMKFKELSDLISVSYRTRKVVNHGLTVGWPLNLIDMLM
jgi:hypothetical protein